MLSMGRVDIVRRSKRGLGHGRNVIGVLIAKVADIWIEGIRWTTSAPSGDGTVIPGRVENNADHPTTFYIGLLHF